MEKGKGKGSRQAIPRISSKKATVVSTSESLTIGVKRPADRSLAYEWTSRIKHEDKQSSNYKRYNTKEKATSGKLHVEKATGRAGVKDEFKKSSTVMIGNKNTGYTEHYVEERYRDVDFGKSSSGERGPNELFTYDSGHGSGYHYHYDNRTVNDYDYGYSYDDHDFDDYY